MVPQGNQKCTTQIRRQYLPWIWCSINNEKANMENPRSIMPQYQVNRCDCTAIGTASLGHIHTFACLLVEFSYPPPPLPSPTPGV